MLAKRLRTLRKNMDITQNELAKKLQITQQAIGYYETGKRQPDYASLEKLADFFDCSIDYLLGRTDNPDSTKPIYNKLGKIQHFVKSEESFVEDISPIEMLKRWVNIFSVATANPPAFPNYNEIDTETKQAIEKTKIELEKLAPNTIPLLGTIRAGVPLLAEDNYEYEVEVPSNLQAEFALKVTGDSMSWVGINEGDLAILKQNNAPSHGMIVAAGIENSEWEATLKFYVEQNGEKCLRAANPDYEDIKINGEHRIIGQVVSIQKEPPSLQDYKRFSINKAIVDEQWERAIEKAAEKGLDGDKVANMIEIMASMSRKL